MAMTQDQRMLTYLVRLARTRHNIENPDIDDVRAVLVNLIREIEEEMNIPNGSGTPQHVLQNADLRSLIQIYRDHIDYLGSLNVTPNSGSGKKAKRGKGFFSDFKRGFAMPFNFVEKSGINSFLEKTPLAPVVPIYRGISSVVGNGRKKQRGPVKC